MSSGSSGVSSTGPRRAIAAASFLCIGFRCRLRPLVVASPASSLVGGLARRSARLGARRICRWPCSSPTARWPLACAAFGLVERSVVAAIAHRVVRHVGSFVVGHCSSSRKPYRSELESLTAAIHPTRTTDRGIAEPSSTRSRTQTTRTPGKRSPRSRPATRETIRPATATTPCSSLLRRKSKNPQTSASARPGSWPTIPPPTRPAERST